MSPIFTLGVFPLTCPVCSPGPPSAHPLPLFALCSWCWWPTVTDVTAGYSQPSPSYRRLETGKRTTIRWWSIFSSSDCDWPDYQNVRRGEWLTTEFWVLTIYYNHNLDTLIHLYTLIHYYTPVRPLDCYRYQRAILLCRGSQENVCWDGWVPWMTWSSGTGGLSLLYIFVRIMGSSQCNKTSAGFLSNNNKSKKC